MSNNYCGDIPNQKPSTIKVQMIKYTELRKRYEMDGAEKTVRHLGDALKKKELRAEDFSIRDLAEGLIPGGHHWIRELDPRNGGTVVMESDGIDMTAFKNVSKQIVFSKILESYGQEVFVASKIVDTIPTRMDGEKLPSSSGIHDTTMEVKPGMPYPNVGFAEDYVDTPSTSKYGLIVPVTKEAVYFDRTHLILSRAAEVGEVLARNKEKRILDTILGITNTYKWKGKEYNTYYSSATDPFFNSLAGNSLSDWQSIENAENMLANMSDPVTKEPILVEPDTVLIMPQKRGVAHRLFNASEVSYGSAGFDTTMTAIPNPFKKYNVVSSRLAYRRLQDSGVSVANSAEYWYFGNFKKAFAYMENWPITVTQSPVGSEADFNRDILVRFKASERGVPAVLNPRYVVKCTS